MTNQPNVDPASIAKSIMDEGAKVTAAMQMLEAATSEMEAALTLNNWDEVEKARQKCVSRYEAVLDARIIAVKYLRDKYRPS